MREHWTDDRMDDLVKHMDAGFRHVDERFGRVDERFGSVEESIRDLRVDGKELRTEMNARFDSMQRLLIQIAGGFIAALLGLIATQL